MQGKSDLTVGYVLQSAAPAGSSPWQVPGRSLGLQGRIIIAVHRAFVPGCVQEGVVGVVVFCDCVNPLTHHHVFQVVLVR